MSDRFGAAIRYSAMACVVAVLSLAGSASAALLDRGPDLVYDDVLNITWTRHAGDRVLRTWDEATAWAANLVFAGFDDWRLPYSNVSKGAFSARPPVNCNSVSELVCRDNEMGYMFYYHLGGSYQDNKTGTQTALGGQQITGIQRVYWSGTWFDDGVSVFIFGGGSDGGSNGFSFTYGDEFPCCWQSAWAVRPGDVAAVPEPATVLLLGVGMLGLVWTRSSRRRRCSFGHSGN